MNEAATTTSSGERSRKIKLTYERLVIECEENYAVLDASHPMEPNDPEGFAPSDQNDAALVAIDAVKDNKRENERSAECWPLPETDCLVKICASPEGLGELEPSAATFAYAVARHLQILGMLLHHMQRAKGEPVTLEATDIPSAA